MWKVKEVVQGYPKQKRRGVLDGGLELTDGYAVKLWIDPDDKEAWFFFHAMEQAMTMRTIARQSLYGCREGEIHPAVLELRWTPNPATPGAGEDQGRIYLLPGARMPGIEHWPGLVQAWVDGSQPGRDKLWHGQRPQHPTGPPDPPA